MLKNMDPVKLELIRSAASKTKGKSGKALAPVMIITSANKKGIRFTPDEMTMIISILKEGKSEEEQARIDQMLKMMHGMLKK